MYDTDYKIQKEIWSHPLFVAPIPVVMNDAYQNSADIEAGKKLSKRVYNCPQYISIAQIIKATFQVPIYAEMLMKPFPSSQQGVYFCY